LCHAPTLFELVSALLSAEFGAALDAVDGFFAGMADALTAGLSTRVRAGMYGDSATKNHQGGYFVAGLFRYNIRLLIACPVMDHIGKQARSK